MNDFILLSAFMRDNYSQEKNKRKEKKRKGKSNESVVGERLKQG